MALKEAHKWKKVGNHWSRLIKMAHFIVNVVFSMGISEYIAFSGIRNHSMCLG